MLALDCTRRLGAFTLDVALVAPAGSTLVLVGESGAGKTTIVNLVAGLLHPDRGTIMVDGTPWFDAARGVAVPPHARPVATVMQDYALFPHLSVFENVAFGLRAQRLARGVCRARTAAMLAQLGIAALAPRRPAELSGGQQQRVALARALVLEPRVLLLDEPLAALDRGARRAVAAELRRLLATIASINLVVTHDPFEALLFGDTIAVVEQGRIAQSGPRHELLSRPRARSVAELMALNFFRGRVIARAPDGLATVACAEGTLRIACAEADAEGDELFVAVDPRDVTVHTAAPSGSAQNVFAAAITELVPEPPLGERVRVVLDTTPPLVAEVTAHAVHALALREGMHVWASFKAVAARGYR